MTDRHATTPDTPSAPCLELFAEFRFEAAHRLPNVPPEHMCARLHGHSYQIRITVVGQIDPKAGWVADFGAIAASVEPVRSELEHQFLNEIDGLSNPTSENVACWLWQRLHSVIAGMSAVEVREMPGLGCIYRGPG
jgi:6-pyruvoyltetrahydropterin/6-carboxytetrahydropterin synthase